MTRASTQGFAVEVVRRPGNGDWTSAMLEAIARPGAPVSLASISSVHWADGGAIDIAAIAPALRAKGAWEGRDEKMPPAMFAMPMATSSRVASIS